MEKVNLPETELGQEKRTREIGLRLAVGAKRWQIPLQFLSEAIITSTTSGFIGVGVGICFYCHGRDGHVDQRPQLSPDTDAFIARLNPKPADLRNPKSLKMTTDKERFRAIREGHEGMFPDSSLTDQEIRDTLAFLSVLRNEGASKGKP
jgi:cytochrome c553